MKKRAATEQFKSNVKVTGARLLQLAAITIVLISSCIPQVNLKSHLKVSPILPKTGEYPECGIRGYKQVTDADLCGVNYVLKADSACQLRGHSYEAWGRSCPSGWAQISTRRDVGVPDEDPNQPSLPGSLAIPRELDVNTCESACQNCANPMPNRATALFEECRAQVHGIESINTCEDHSQPLYSSCTLYATREEIPVRLQNLKDTVSLVGPSLVKWRGIYETLKGTEESSACFIKNYIGNPIYEEMVSALKIQFLSSFGRNWSLELCPVNSGTGLVEVVQCEATNVTQSCTASRAYHAMIEELKSVITNLTVLENDVVAQRDGGVKAEILAIKNYATGCQSLDSATCSAP